jgi:hypothetical protein
MALFIKDKTDRLDPPQITACPDTSCAAYTEVIVPDKKGLIFYDGEIRGNPFGRGRGDPDIVGHILEFTMSELRAASFILRDIG